MVGSVAVDTHTVLWYLSNDPKLSDTARLTLVNAAQSPGNIVAPSICIVETIYLA